MEGGYGSMDDGAESESDGTWEYGNSDRDSGVATPTRTPSMAGSLSTYSMPGSPLHHDDFDDVDFEPA